MNNLGSCYPCATTHKVNSPLLLRGAPIGLELLPFAGWDRDVSITVRFEDNPMHALAERVRRGEEGAVEDFRREMSLALEGMVRLALRKRSCVSFFEHSVRAEAEKLRRSSRLSRDDLARQIAGALCRDMIDRLQTGGRLKDTMAEAGTGSAASMFDTVAAGRDGTIRSE